MVFPVNMTENAGAPSDESQAMADANTVMAALFQNPSDPYGPSVSQAIQNIIEGSSVSSAQQMIANLLGPNGQYTQRLQADMANVPEPFQKVIQDVLNLANTAINQQSTDPTLMATLSSLQGSAYAFSAVFDNFYTAGYKIPTSDQVTDMETVYQADFIAQNGYQCATMHPEETNYLTALENALNGPIGVIAGSGYEYAGNLNQDLSAFLNNPQDNSSVQDFDQYAQLYCQNIYNNL